MTITATSDNQIRKSNIRNWTIGLQTFATGSLPRSGFSATGVTGYWIGTAASVCLDARGLDHHGPLLGLIGNVLAKIGGRTRNQPAAHLRKLRLRDCVIPTFRHGVTHGP